MRRLFKNAEITVEPGVGHYIFMHKDTNGWDLVLRELLALDGKTPDDQKALKAEFNARKYSELDTMALRYETEPFFRQWVDTTQQGKETIRELIATNDQKTARDINSKWKKVIEQRTAALLENIRGTERSGREFYAANKEVIEKLGKKGTDNESITHRYFDFLDKLPGNDKDRWEFRTDKKVFEITDAQQRQRAENVLQFPTQKREKKRPQEREAIDSLSRAN